MSWQVSAGIYLYFSHKPALLRCNTTWIGLLPAGLDIGQAVNPDGKKILKNFHPSTSKDVQVESLQHNWVKLPPHSAQHHIVSVICVLRQQLLKCISLCTVFVVILRLSEHCRQSQQGLHECPFFSVEYLLLHVLFLEVFTEVPGQFEWL